MLSNSDPRQKNPENTFFDDLYAGFHIQRISIFRSICSIAEKREAVNADQKLLRINIRW